MISCEKDEGEGGGATIIGRVFTIDYNAEFTFKKDSFYSPDVDVFIIYGKDSIYSDDFKTGLGGWYRFQYLRPGDYKVYAFSKDKTFKSPTGLIPVIKDVKIKNNDETVVVEDLIIVD
jgi:hypothetical protein